MTPSGAEAERKRAARAGRRILARALPPGFAGWIDRLAESHEAPQEVYAWSGALTAIALGLEQAFQESGSEVRDHILRLHALLSEGAAIEGTSAGGELAPFIPWLGQRLAASEASPSPRIVLMQWIDVASERLTLRRYYRADLPAHHARTLLVIPARMLGLTAGETDAAARREPAPPPTETDVALACLRFVDLLDAERLAEEGKNRILAPDSGDFGGFYGVSENVQPPTEEELEAAIRDLRQQTASLTETGSFPPPLQAILEDVERALGGWQEDRQWPERFQWKSPVSRRPSPSLLQRLLGKR